MNKLLLALLFSISATITNAQKVYFIYIQSESGQAFYVKLENRVISSASSGYLILSKLRDSTYDLTIGFPQNKWPEHKFSVAVNKNDHGFLLKNFGEKGWGLFDLQSLSVQMGVADAAKNGTGQFSDRDISPFTAILVKAADDPSLLDKPGRPENEEKKPAAEVVVAEKKTVEIPAEVKVSDIDSDKAAETVKNEEKKPGPEVVIAEKKVAEVPAEVKVPETVKNEEKKPAAEVVTAEKKMEAVVVEVKASETVKNEEQKSSGQGDNSSIIQVSDGTNIKSEEGNVNDFGGGTAYKPTLIKKWAESSTTEGFGLVFIDAVKEGQNDTIRILIPNPKVLEVQANDPAVAKEEKKFIELTDSAKLDKNETVQLYAKPENDSLAKKDSVIVINKCSVLADENDFFQLRKQMAAAENDDDMIAAGRKYFRLKCFSTQQIKNLGVLFLTDMGKYNFFDAAYNYVADPLNFKTLETEIRDEYYANRFRAMIRN